jgi:SAM-dependent methyltransferase
VRRGKPVPDEKPDDAASRREFSWAMHHRSVHVAPAVAAQVPLHDAKRLLDLGGGPGTYALAFLARFHDLHATVCDRVPALEVAKELASRVRHGRRLSYVPLDFMTDRIPGRYDVIWYSNVLHIYSADQNRRLFRRLRTNLVPGGRLIIQDAFLWDREGLQPPEANLFAATMLLFTERGNTYTAKETAGWLKEAGFTRIRRLTLKVGTGDWEGGLLEASRPALPRESRGRR